MMTSAASTASSASCSCMGDGHDPLGIPADELERLPKVMELRLRDRVGPTTGAAKGAPSLLDRASATAAWVLAHAQQWQSAELRNVTGEPQLGALAERNPHGPGGGEGPGSDSPDCGEGDPDLKPLVEKMELLKVKRQQAALHCERFTAMMEATLGQQSPTGSASCLAQAALSHAMFSESDRVYYNSERGTGPSEERSPRSGGTSWHGGDRAMRVMAKSSRARGRKRSSTIWAPRHTGSSFDTLWHPIASPDNGGTSWHAGARATSNEATTDMA